MWSLRLSLSCIAIACAVAASTPIARGQTDGVGHLRLIDRLDRPTDGYCLDVLGVGRNLRPDLPIFAHNCKSGLTPDSAVTLTEKGEIVFTALNLCVTAFGVNGRALPGAPIILRPCAGRAAFFDSIPLQRFEWITEKRLKIIGSALCLSVGVDVDRTYSAADRWRMLTVDRCATTPIERTAWEFVRLN